MAADFGLLFNTPQFKPAPVAAGIMQGIQNASDINYKNAQTANTQQQMNVQKMQAVQNLAGSVKFNPTQANLDATKKMAASYGLDVSQIPNNIQDAMPYIDTAYFNSGIALNRMKAQVELGMLGVNATANLTRAQSEATQAGNYDQANKIGVMLNNVQNGMDGINNLGSPSYDNQQSGAITQQGSSAPGQTGFTPIQGTPGNNQVANSQPNTNLTNGPYTVNMGPGMVKGQEAQNEENVKFSNALDDGRTTARSEALDLNLANASLNSPGIKTGPISGYLRGLTTPGQILQKVSSRLFLDKLQALVSNGGGQIRSNQSIAKSIQQSLMQNTLNQDANYLITDAERTAVNNRTMQADISDKLKSMGIVDKGTISKIIDDTYQGIPLQDPKTGMLRPELLDINKGVGAAALNAALHGQVLKIDPSINSQLIQQTPEVENQIKHDYPSATRTQISQMIKLQNEKLLNDAVAKQLSGNPQQSNNTQSPQANNTVAIGNKLAQAIAPQESGGKYNAIGPILSNGERPIGKYQVLPSNVRSWTKEILGKQMTPQEFLNNPQAQDTVAAVKLGQYFQQTGNAADAVSMWFSGKPAKNNNSRDVLGTSVPQYVRNALIKLPSTINQNNPQNNNNNFTATSGVRD